MKTQSLLITLISIILFISSLPLVAAELVIGDGDVYQQEDGSRGDRRDLKMYEGGRIIGRADGSSTHFQTGSIFVSGGDVEANLLLNYVPLVEITGGRFRGFLDVILQPESMVTISEGIFDNVFNIIASTESVVANISGGVFDRFSMRSLRGTLSITGGVYKKPVKLTNLFGSVHIQGGDFQSGFEMSRATSAGVLPVVEFTGSNWQIDGELLDFINGSSDISIRSGVLTGTLKDGNSISYEIITSSPEKPFSTRVHLVSDLVEATITPAHLINFQSKAGRSYSLQYTEDFVIWIPVEEGVIGTGEMMKFGVARDKPLEFYRVVEFIE